MFKYIIYLIALTIGLITSACDPREHPLHNEQDAKELLVYCGITMAPAVTDIIFEFEKNCNCKVKMIYDGSGNILQAAKLSQQGDLFLPGSASYIKKLEDEGLVLSKKTIGYNQAVILVEKGNPKKISSDLSNLYDKRYKTILGSPTTGSIGKETHKILTKLGIYDKVFDNSIELATDSKRLAKAIREKDADLCINWKATAFAEINKNYVDFIEIGDDIAEKKALVMGVLKFARHPELAQQFLEFSAGENGQKIMKAYGF